MFDAEFSAELVELVFPALRAFAQAKESVGELLPIIRKYASDAKWSGAFMVAQKSGAHWRLSFSCRPE